MTGNEITSEGESLVILLCYNVPTNTARIDFLLIVIILCLTNRHADTF